MPDFQSTENVQFSPCKKLTLSKQEIIRHNVFQEVLYVFSNY